jgi:hypothetical protein
LQFLSNYMEHIDFLVILQQNEDFRSNNFSLLAFLRA